MARFISLSVLACVALTSTGISPASAQGVPTPTFQSFVCADGARFTAAFLKYDPKWAHLQLDGKAVALRKRFTLSGARYTGRGITLTMTKSGTVLRHGKRGPTRCTPT